MTTVGVTGAGGGIGGAVLRALRRSRLPLRKVVCFDMDPSAAGLHAGDRGYLVPPADDGGYQRMLLDLCAREKVDVLMVGTDPELIPVVVVAADLEAVGCTPIVSSVAANKICRDKHRCAELLTGAGFPFTGTVKMSEVDELAQSVGFPIVLKPAGGSASEGVTVVFNREELERYRDLEAYIAQDYLLSVEWGVTKAELTREQVYAGDTLVQRDEISVQVLLDRDGETLGTFTSRNTLKAGVPMVIRPIARDDSGATEIALEMARFLVPLGLRGPCNFQCKLTRDGPYFFEINPRFTGITGVRAAMGFNEVEAAIRHFVLGQDGDQVAGECLQTNFSHVCSRYTTEYLFPADSPAALRAGGACAGRGRGVAL